MSSTENDLAHRRALAWAAFKKLDKIWLAKHVSVKLKVNILRASVFSVLLYGSETWILTKDLETQLNSFGLHCHRRILGISLLDHIRNEEIYAQVGQLPLSETAQYRQLSWVGHALRREESLPSRIFALYTPMHGHAKKGRAKMSYLAYVAKLLIRRGMPERLTYTEIVELAQDRKRWDSILKLSPSTE